MPLGITMENYKTWYLKRVHEKRLARLAGMALDDGRPVISTQGTYLLSMMSYPDYIHPAVYITTSLVAPTACNPRIRV
jgi:hypothetical protein